MPQLQGLFFKYLLAQTTQIFTLFRPCLISKQGYKSLVRPKPRVYGLYRESDFQSDEESSCFNLQVVVPNLTGGFDCPALARKIDTWNLKSSAKALAFAWDYEFLKREQIQYDVLKELDLFQQNLKDFLTLFCNCKFRFCTFAVFSRDSASSACLVAEDSNVNPFDL